MAVCDICMTPTNWNAGATYSPDQFRALVHRGFEPDAATMATAFAQFPIAVARKAWKQGALESPTVWLLCPSCARRAANIAPDIVPSGIPEKSTSSPAQPESTASNSGCAIILALVVAATAISLLLTVGLVVGHSIAER